MVNDIYFDIFQIYSFSNSTYEPHFEIREVCLWLNKRVQISATEEYWLRSKHCRKNEPDASDMQCFNYPAQNLELQYYW